MQFNFFGNKCCNHNQLLYLTSEKFKNQIVCMFGKKTNEFETTLTILYLHELRLFK